MATPRKRAQPKPETPEVAEAVQPDPAEAPDAVLVVKVVSDDGSISTHVQALGNIQATEVQTILELGIAGWRRQIGLVGQS